MIEVMRGQAAVLNVGEGDLTLSFDKSNPAERERAAKIVTDMLKRGYAILVQIGTEKVDERVVPIYRRAHAFDEKTCEYIVAGGPDEKIEVGKLIEDEEKPGLVERVKRAVGRGRKRGATKYRVPAERTRSVGVSRTSGG